MSTINSIFTKENLIKQSANVQKIKRSREYLLDKTTAKELNTYLNFGVFPVYADTYPAEYDPNDGYKRTKDSSKAGTPGVRSLFNRAGAVILGSSDGEFNVDIANDAHDWRIANNVPLMDSPKTRQKIRQTSGCTIKELVQSSSQGLMGQETYAYSDFMYCKHLGRVSNNYMITLRRFPLPVDDFIGSVNVSDSNQLTASNASSIGCMVTWLGVSGNSMSDILKYNFSMPFKEATAERQQLGESADENQTMLNNIFSVFDEKYRKQYQDGYSSEAANGALSYLGIKAGNAPYKHIPTFEDSNKVYGPLDTIRDTYVRDDKGLTFGQSFSLVFEYELKSYNGINGKQAMLDLISNILNVTYTTGSFWGGGYKGFAAHQSNIFANMEMFKARGGFTNFIDAFAEDLNTISDTVGAKFKGPDGKLSWKSVFQELNSIGGMILSGMLNKLGRPQKAMYNALLSPAPIGFWHVTIGNPKRPIMSIGNMIIKNTTIEHTGPLGLDDFPTGIKVTVELERGKPRDLRDIEKLYMQGNDRIYTSMGEKVFDMYKNSELYNNAKGRDGRVRGYTPQVDTATVETTINSDNTPTIKIKDLEKLNSSMKKYFGTTDAYSIYVAAAEQEFGSGKKKPSTEANKNVVGGDGNTAKTGGYYGNGK